MSKTITLLSDNNHHSAIIAGPLAFNRFYFKEFLKEHQIDQTNNPDFEWPPMFMTLHPNTLQIVHDLILDQVESVQCSILHLQFQHPQVLGDIDDESCKQVYGAYQGVINRLRKRLDSSNWGHIVITGVPLNMCRDIVDLELEWQMTMEYPITSLQSVKEETLVKFKRATIK